MTRHLVLASLLLSLCGLSACSKDSGEKKTPKPGGLTALVQAQDDSVITIVDLDGKPLVGAQVLIGPEKDQPFAGNFLVTDAQGQFTAPADWQDAQPVTIQAANRIRITYMEQKPQGQTFKVRRTEGRGAYQLSGTTTGFAPVDRDGLIDFAIVLPAFSRLDLFTFDVSKVISNQNDIITVLGQQVEIPSNISLPKQRESYFLPVTLEKPVYRTYFRTTGTKKVVTLRGQFPFKEVVDELRGQADFISLINKFSIQGGSIKNIHVSSSGSTADLPVGDMTFANSRRMNAPNFRSDEVVIAASMNPSGDLMYPSDFKNLTARQPQTLQIASSNAVLLTVAKRKTETQKGSYNGRVSAAVQPFSSGASPELLALIDDPRLISPSAIQVPTARATNNIAPVATYASLSRVTKKSVAGAPVDAEAIEILTTEWEVYAPDWVQNVALPKWPKAPGPLSQTTDQPTEDSQDENAEPLAGQMRWGVTLVGQSPTVSKGELGPDLLETATHATYSAIDF